MIPFNRPHETGKEIGNIQKALALGKLSGDRFFTKKAHEKLVALTGAQSALLTHSCTAALEMAVILADIGPGDEVIMPSYTFVSTANCVVAKGGIPVFVDIRADTKNINETIIERALTKKTKAILPVHYAGVSCDMDVINGVAKDRNLLVIEDAAQAYFSKYKNQHLGSIGDLGAYSFHETKNITSGEGGALLINNQKFIERAEIIREKGTDRSKFFRGEVDKYTWVDVGSSFLPCELVAAFLDAQLENAGVITRKRLEIWNRYANAFSDLITSERVGGPCIPDYAEHNGHMFYLMLRDVRDRDRFIAYMKAQEIYCMFHYVPLHSSPGGIKYGRCSGDLGVTTNVSERLVRLPLWADLSDDQEKVVSVALEFFKNN